MVEPIPRVGVGTSVRVAVDEISDKATVAGFGVADDGVGEMVLGVSVAKKLLRK